MEIKITDCKPIHKEVVAKVRSGMPKREQLDDLSDFFKVMGDSTRVRLLWSREQNEMCVCDLATLLDMTKSAVSHQLKALKNAKLVKSRREGKHVFYSLDDEHIKDILEKGMEHITE